MNSVSGRNAVAVADRPIPTYPDLAGKVAAITGGSRGIGAATCRVLAANHVALAINGRKPSAVDAVAGEAREHGVDVVGFPGDARSAQDMRRFAEQAGAELGPVDILLPFAGGFEAFTPIERIDEEEWRDVIDANLTATHLMVQAFLPAMIERGSGAIVTMATNGARTLDKLLTASYVAAKAGVVQYTRHIAKELGPRGIRANAIAPATVSSERIERIMDGASIERTAAMAPLGTMGTPLDCALATLFLVSDSAAWLTGITLDIAGGRVMM
jgi:3-oxoacyl-[acyl-carrier protein] reductase